MNAFKIVNLFALDNILLIQKLYLQKRHGLESLKLKVIVDDFSKMKYAKLYF